MSGLRGLVRLTGRRSGAPLRTSLLPGLLEVLRDGPAPLRTNAAGAGASASLAVALIVPQFRRGSGGHSTIAELVRQLEQRDHQLSIWVEDQEGRHSGESEAETAALFREFFGPTRARVRRSFSAWDGADIVMATGWQTVPRALRLTDAHARAYLVQDHEPEFYATSAERLWAEWTYRQGLHCVCASQWLADLVRTRYGASTSPFELGVDHERYGPRPVERRDDLVLFYARATTPRRAVPLGLLALSELHRRRPDVQIALYGEATDVLTSVPHQHLGVLEPSQLSEVYASATVGLVLSLTNPSLIPTEMLACGLPVVDVASESMRATFGDDGPVELAAPDPMAMCRAIERLLDDAALRADRSRAGTRLAAGRTWPSAAVQVEAGLRQALRPAG